MDKINIAEKFTKFSDYWSPKIIAEANGQHVRVAKLKGEFVWHSHADEDELFIVIKGTLTVHFRDRSEVISEGEMIVIPRGVEHKPEAEDEVHLINITKAEATHTGEIKTDITIEISDMQKI
ncbi:MAG: cupin domain-containing protein [Methyloligellaceae bacterium]